jgi:hypothetical protein
VFHSSGLSEDYIRIQKRITIVPANWLINKAGQLLNVASDFCRVSAPDSLPVFFYDVKLLSYSSKAFLSVAFFWSF